MNIVALRETLPGEARVALMPDSVKKLVAAKASVSVESGAGLGAARTDDDYVEAGAEVSADRNALISRCGRAGYSKPSGERSVCGTQTGCGGARLPATARRARGPRSPRWPMA